MALWRIEKPKNEPFLEFRPGTKERELLKKKLEEVKSRTVEIPLIIGGKEVKTGETVEIRAPHDKDTVLAVAHLAGEEEIRDAIEKALDAWTKWSEMEWYHRTSVFLKAADLLAGPYRLEADAVIMLNHSKTPWEAEIDLAELVDFWRFGAYYARFIFEQQPEQAPGELNRVEWRPWRGLCSPSRPSTSSA